jgi:hypothetical protein
MRDPAAILRANRADPEIEARRLNGLRRNWDDPEMKAKRTAILLETSMTPQARAAQKAGAKASWADPEVRARRVAAIREAAKHNREAKAAGVRAHHQRERMVKARRNLAKQIVAAAGLMPLRETVDFAVKMLDSGAHPHVVSISLKRAA